MSIITVVVVLYCCYNSFLWVSLAIRETMNPKPRLDLTIEF